MVAEHNCDSCSGCTARHTDEHVAEEVSAAPYLLFATVVVVVASFAAKWLFF